MTFIIIAAYFLLLAIVSVISYRKGFNNVFSTGKTMPWLIAGFSLFVINPDIINVLSKMGIAATEGYQGMWIFYSGVLGAGFLPILFAPLWGRLKFMTDNQFILLRFSGRPAKILHLFRAVYVGYLVVALFIAQVFIGMSKLVMVFFELSYLQSYLLISVLVLLLIAKNSLNLKVRTDLLNGIIYILAFALGAYYVINHYGGAEEVYSRLNTEYRDYIKLFPSGLDSTAFGSLPTLLVYFGVQWWSINVLDGGGPEAQRFMNTGSPLKAFKAAFLPLILFSLVFLFHSFVIDAGILMINDPAAAVGASAAMPDNEAVFIYLFKDAMPGGMAAFVFIAFLVGFISFTESFINWGAGFITVDVIKTYLFRHSTEKTYARFSYLIMLLIAATGIVIAWNNTYLLGLQKFVFAMGAGVGPVFILRWFWPRINAWSQFTAMLSSLVYAVSWDLLYDHSVTFSSMTDTQLASLNISYYAFKLLVLTALVTISWLTVTFLTRPTSKKTVEHFFITLKSKEQISPRSFLLLLIYPVISILPFLFIWQFKFGSPAAALGMILVWILLIYYTVRQMALKYN